uniref:Chromosome 1 open reading frame 216 n=1 Tax=Latimeria chalumnae TaxID=7897 RepID=H3BA82_LATCH
IKEREFKQDKNFNIVGESYEKNENFSQILARIQTEGESVKLEYETNPSVKLNLLIESRKMESGLGDSFNNAESEETSPSGEVVPIPPEEAAIVSVQQGEKSEEVKDNYNNFACSPLEDNGYASSSLSIDSPDSGNGNTWDHVENNPHPDDNKDSLDSDTLFPTLLEAFQSLQDKERFKEQEKERHQAQLIMYRRLALLRWIRSLQQKIIDQQNRLQENYDTILDNRKELLR